MTYKKYLIHGSILLALAVMFGAFGAHGLKGQVPSKALHTFITGNQYHWYHAMGMLLLGLLKFNFKELNLKWTGIFLWIGLIFFSGGCYLYGLYQLRFFAMIVPIGGLSFIFAWISLTIKLKKLK